MRTNDFNAILKTTVRAGSILLFAAVAALGQTVVTPPDFGVVALGASVTQTVILDNTLGTVPIDPIPSASLAFTTGFSLSTTSPGSCVSSGAAVAATCTIGVVFGPATAGPATGTLTITATSTTSGVTTPLNVTGSPVPLTGTGYQPTVTASSTPLIFGDPGPGATSGAQPVTLTNASVTPLTFSLTFDNSAYSAAAGGTCPTPLVLGGSGNPTSCTVNLVFTAPAVDTTAETGNLVVTATYLTSTNVTVSGSPLALTDNGTPAGATGVTPTDVDLTAAAYNFTLPDGSTVPMWGYSCAPTMAPSTCRSLNPNAHSWSPVVITIPTGQDLAIELTNNLSFTPTGSTTPNTVPTSLVIVGQLGGGLGAPPTTTLSPTHAAQSTTWPTANVAGVTNVPPPQPPRVQSFGTEVEAGTTQRLVWKNPRPGTYLIESGTHPSIQGPMGLYGILVVTTAPTTTGSTEIAAGTAYPGVNYDADVPLLLSEIDPVQNNAVQAAVNTANFSETAVWSGQPGGCGNPTSSTYNTCYPPAVNYSPRYFLFNGVAFDRTNAANSLFSAFPATLVPASGTGSVLVRFVNAGLKMHLPSIVGSLTGTTPVGGFALVAEDGNPVPGLPRVQSNVFMAAGKTYDVMINAPASAPGATALPVYDRELSLSGNAINRDSGMLAYISVNGAGVPAAGLIAPAVARPDKYNSLVAGQTFTVSDPSKGVMANDTNVFGVNLLTQATNGTVTLNANGTFSYVPSTASTASDSFTYCANGSVTSSVCSSGLTATVTLNPATLEGASGITLNNITYTSNQATFLKIPPPGVLSVDKDGAGYPLTVSAASVTPVTGLTLNMDANGGFNATVPSPGTYTFTYQAKNSQGTLSSGTATVTLIFPTGSGLNVSVVDGASKVPLSGQDYRWIIEEDRSFYIDPTKTTNSGPSGPITPILGVNFHTSDMPYVAQGCTGPLSCEGGQTIIDPATGNHVAAVCDLGNGACRPDTTGNGQTPVFPSQVVLDPTKRYYISVLPGDAANPFQTGATAACAPYNGSASSGCGHSMGGAPIAPGQTSVTVLVEQDPFPTGKLSVNVFEDDFPLNGEQDSGGGVDIVSPNEPGLGGFNIVLWDDMGGSGDVTGQMTYDMFNQPLGNSLDGQIDPATGLNACPITKAGQGITGMIVTCPKYESDGATLSPLAGQAVVSNLMPGRFSVQAIPGADRIARGEEWLQTNTLDGQKAHDSFIRIGEPAYFQEFGPAGYHVSIGFANPKIINSRLAAVCNGTDPNLQASPCNNTLTGKVTTERMSRTPDERLYSSGSRDSFYFTQCYVSFGDPDGEDFAFTMCNPDGTFSFSGLPSGNWRVTTFDQWNDQLVDGLSTPVGLGGSTLCPGQGSSASVCNMGDIAASQWQANVYTRTFIDDNKDGVSQASEAGIPLLNTTVRYRDGSMANNLLTDLHGIANFNETFPLFNWYVVETDTTRYKTTGIHTVYDAGGPADGSASCGLPGSPACGTSVVGKFLANTYEANPLPGNLSVPGAVYCSNADCTGSSIGGGPVPSSTTSNSTGRIDPPWVSAEGWQGFSGQNNFIEFGKTPYVPGENGGIHGHVIYASTRPFDDPYMLVQTQWEPLVPHVTMNLYQEGTAADGVTQTLTLVDTTQTSSFDDWAQGFRSDGIPNMNCPGQSTSDLFYFSLYNQPFYLNAYNATHGGPPATVLPYNSQYKCYDGMHNWNQLQPAPYDGMYSFPSVTGINPTTGKPTGTNCTICVSDPDTTDAYRSGLPMLPAGKYVVEVVPPPGYELVKEEDKNILIGDNFIAPVTQQFGGLGNIFIMPDQASVSSEYNANNPQNMTQNMGATPLNGIVPGFVPEPLWPCVGEARIVPDYISLYPQSKQVSPFAGATRNLCDRKEVTLGDQMGAIAKFFIYTSTHKASKFTGVITDDFTSEFDPFSPQFGEKFSPANLPVSIKDWTGAEISRVYSDWWGDYDGLTYSTWEVNPPNPTVYSPTMMVTCMNDSGTGTTPDPLFNPEYSQFCYEIPFMPGQTQYMDTPVVPTSAFAGAGYNNPDCDYPDATPEIKEVDGDSIGPWVGAAGHTITITAVGDQAVQNNGYSGPAATTAPFNQKTVTRHYGFGSQCTSPTANNATCNTLSAVTIGGVPATITSWGDTQIKIQVPFGVPACAVQQQAQYSGAVPATQCGQLVITAGNGKQSIDAVTVTIGGKAPTHVAGGAIQDAIDAASPGDLIIVNPGTYNELLIMWKPVRLQGVGAATSMINASPHPAGKLGPWRAKVNCLFGLALNGQPYSTAGNLVPNPIPGLPPEPLNLYDPTGATTCGGWTGFNAGPNNPQVDRLPLESLVGWDTTVNGNLAEMLQEPSLMGAYEGAAITVLAKGVRYPPGVEVFGACNCDTATGSFVPHEGQMPVPTVELTSNDCSTSSTDPTNPFPSNFQCNPSRIDGLAITNSSQGGGGIFIHAWAHNLEIANNRIYNNTGTMSGGITVGQSEAPDALLSGNGGDPVGYNGGVLAGFDQQPWTCVPGAVVQTSATPYGYDQVVSPPGFVFNQQLPYCYNLNVNVHNNAVTRNSSIGDEAFSSTPAGGGGVTFCTGADYYKFNYNWVCGNLSTGDGGGVAHLGFSYNGDIEHNSILFNQATNPTIPTNGGGLIIMSTAPDGASLTQPECGSVTDIDCGPGLGDGTGPGLVINANLILGNQAESGSGGGLALQQINGTDVVKLPATPSLWNSANVTNNIIGNNVSGWDGGGVSLLDALSVNFINNTVISNDSTASSGVLFNTLGAPLASTLGTNCMTSSTSSCPQPAGLVSIPNSAVLTGHLPATITCPAGHYSGSSATNGSCRALSYPLLGNDVFWQNRSFYIGVGSLGGGTLNQQNVVALYNAFTSNRVMSEPSASATTANGGGSIVTGGTGACVPGTSYWDIGVRGDTGPSNHGSGFTLAPAYSVLTDAGDYPGANNLGSNPMVVSQYCNGSRTPPEYLSMGYQVPPGISDATVPNPIFNLTPAATVDEGNNWVNISWGPLSLTNSVTGSWLGNYAMTLGSLAIDYIPTSAAGNFPSTDFFGNPRPDPAVPNRIDIGAVEYQNSGVGTLTSIAPATGAQGTAVPVTITGTLLAGTSAVNVSGSGITVSSVIAVSATTVTATFTIAPNATLSARNVTITTPAGTTNAVTFTVVAPPAPTLALIAPNSGVRGSAAAVVLTGTNFVTGSTVVITAPTNGVSVGGVAVVNSTTITATVTSSASAVIGSVNLSVVTVGGSSNSMPFFVTGPVLTSIAPASHLRPLTGTTVVPVTLTGTGLTNTTAVNVSGSGIAVSSLAVVNDTTVTANFTISASASGTARNVTVTESAGGTSNAVTFTVLTPPGALTSITPNTGALGTSETVTINGVGGLTGTTGVNVSGGGITVSNLTVVSDTIVTATFAVSASAALTARNVTLTTPGGLTNAETFTVVLPGTPILSSITPASGLRRTAAAPNPVTVTLSGNNFTTTGTSIAILAPANGLSVTGVTVVSPTQITATFNTTTSATLGPRSITVVTPGGTSGTATYTVLGPALTSIVNTLTGLPSGPRNTTVPVTLTGSGLTGTTAINVPGGGVTVTALTVVNDTTITANFAISAGTSLTARNVTVTAPGGISNPVTFTVTALPVPVLTSIAPPTGVRNTTVPVTLTGTGLTGATAINVSGNFSGSVTVSGLTVVNDTTVTANFAISANASATVRSVTLTTLGGTSNTVPFTVLGPSLVSVTPTQGTRGSVNVPIAFIGNNLTGATGLTGLGSGVTLVPGSLTVIDASHVTAMLNISATTTLGIRSIGIATPIGNTNTVPFTINNPAAPTLTSINPTSGTHPASGSLAVPVTLTGTNFTATGTTVAIAAPISGVTVTGVTVVNPTTITATFNIASTATLTTGTVSVTTPGGTSNTVTFTVN
jgi:hypothetical protein